MKDDDNVPCKECDDKSGIFFCRKSCGMDVQYQIVVLKVVTYALSRHMERLPATMRASGVIRHAYRDLDAIEGGDLTGDGQGYLRPEEWVKVIADIRRTVGNRSLLSDMETQEVKEILKQIAWEDISKDFQRVALYACGAEAIDLFK